MTGVSGSAPFKTSVFKQAQILLPSRCHIRALVSVVRQHRLTDLLRNHAAAEIAVHMSGQTIARVGKKVPMEPGLT